jgi:hypothetical protein
VNDNITPTAEQVRQVFASLLVHRDTERLQTQIARLFEGMPGILDTITALVFVQVIGLAIGQQQQQSPPRRLLGKQAAGMANGGAHAGVITGFDGIDAATHPGIIGFIEGLQLVEADRVASPRGKAMATRMILPLYIHDIYQFF